MQRTSVVLALLAALAVAIPSHAAPPFGSFGGLVAGGNGGGGVLPIHGWALDDDGVAAVDILVDGIVVGRAQYGRQRPGVTDSFPGFPDSAAPGFAFQLDTTHYLNGLHRVSARILSNSGEIRGLNTITLQFTNLSHNLIPFGGIDFPQPDAELFGRCNVLDPNRVYSVILGHALDVGVERRDHGVGYVELLIDGSLRENSIQDCHFSVPEGGLSDCYGMRRLDIAQVYPNLSDGPHAGFRFVIDIGLLLNQGYTPGRHILTIRAGDVAGQVTKIASIPVTFTCDDFIPNQPSFGEVRQPRLGLTYGGTVELHGWALDREAVNAVIVHVDGVRLGDAEYGFARPGVTTLYPGFFDSAAPGWRFFLDTTELSNGRHTAQILVRDQGGQLTMIGERLFTVFNP